MGLSDLLWRTSFYLLVGFLTSEKYLECKNHPKSLVLHDLNIPGRACIFCFVLLFFLDLNWLSIPLEVKVK